MSFADYRFINNCRTIIEHGFSDEAFQVRPRWEDGTPAHTKKMLHLVDHYQLAQDSIPVMTMRKTGFRTCIDEILWIYQKKTSEISQINSHIWDEWDVGDGSIGRAYGYQIALCSPHHKYDPAKDTDAILEQFPSSTIGEAVKLGNKELYVWLDQMDAVLWDLTYNPGSRSIMTSTYNHADLYAMGLRPCAYSMTYNVTKDAEGNMVLNSMLNQRSQDMLTANNWNAVQYSVLTHMIAQHCGMKVGQFTHVICDAHIYDRHIPVVQDMIARYDAIIGDDDSVIDRLPHPNPKFWINPEIKNFYDFTVNDFKLLDYEHEPFDYKIPVAV